MTFTDTGKAIGAVSRLLRARIEQRIRENKASGEPAVSVTVGKIEDQKKSDGLTLNLFLYEIQFDGSLKNTEIFIGRSPPAWLILKYMMTSADNGVSGGDTTHNALSRGIQALQELNFMGVESLKGDADYNVLKDNPEALKITFDDMSPDLISKIMQGMADAYRTSVGFQVRPVMVAGSEPPSYSMLVGVDYTETPNVRIGELGVHRLVLVSMGPEVTEVSPSKFEASAAGTKTMKIKIKGSGFGAPGLVLSLGPVALPIIDCETAMLHSVVDDDICSGDLISAGSYPLSVAYALPDGRLRQSDIFACNLLPRLDSAVPNGGGIDMAGALLGQDGDSNRAADDIIVALYQDDKVAKVYEGITGTDSSQKTLRLQDTGGLHGAYRLFLIVNGQQALNSPVVSLP